MTSSKANDVRRTLVSVIRQVEHVSEVTCLRTATRTIASALVPRTETYLVVGYSTGNVSVYSCSSFRVLWSARVHHLDASLVELYVVDDLLLTQSRTGQVGLWDIDWEGRRFVNERRLDNEGDNGDEFNRVYSFSRMCCVPDRHCVAYPSRGGRVTVHNYMTDEKIVLDTTSHGMVTSLAGTYVRGVDASAQSRDKLVVCVGHESGLVEMYHVVVEDGSSRMVCGIEGQGMDPCVALDCWASPDGTLIRIARGFAGDGTNASGTSASKNEKNPPLVHLGVVTLDACCRYTNTACVMEPPKGMTATLRGMDQVIFRKDGKYAAVACWDGKVRIYRASTGKLVDVIVHHRQASTCFAFETRGKFLAVGSRDGTCSLFSIKNR